LVFPHRLSTRLRVSLRIGTSVPCYSHLQVASDNSLDDSIKTAQKEIVEQEIFDELIKEAGNLPSASARVSERLIIIDAAQGLELGFEMVDSSVVAPSPPGPTSEVEGHATCELIYSMLHVLLLRAHAHNKAFRLGITGVMRAAGLVRPPTTPLILQPVLDLLQYQVFCGRIRSELDQGARALSVIGVPVSLRFDVVGENGKQVVKSLVEDVRGRVGGEAVMRIDDRHSIRLTFLSPSTLVAHLPQATISIVSIPQLRQLLVDEIERSLLGRICEIGTDVCETISGTWFIDEMMCRSVGRWEGCVLNFRVKCVDRLKVDCFALRLVAKDKDTASIPEQFAYGSREDKSVGLFSWVRHIIEDTLSV